ncbi:MAG: hypothetical protein OEV66_12495, partial [Spirochaetia bacterium]|nr:hypothetical protein [Spirochaetia bacterium]
MIKEHEKKFLEFLSLKSSYDYDPEFVEIVQTHISIVAIAPPYVYKIKKNIKLDFLDYSSVEKRKLFLEREIQLNRRLCENIYLELVPIYEFEGLLSFEKFYHSSVRIYDNALKMNYLKPEFCLTNILKNALFLDDKMDALIEKLGKFYFTAEQDKVSTEISNHGKPAAVRAMFQNNLLELEKIVSGKYTAVILDALSKFESTYFSRNKRIFEERCESGFIKDGHGDLRLEHIYIQDNNISIYDCIEFNDSFRYIDILNDLAFLMMELDFGGYEEISLRFQTRLFNYFLSHYQTSGGEPVLVYYNIYRALV